MDAEDLKASLIHALNFGLADPLLDSICRCCESYECGGLAELEKDLFRLQIDAMSILLAWQKNQRELEKYRRESMSHALEEAVSHAAEDRRLSGKFTDEEGDHEALEAYRHPPRQAA